jgi:hypothetical protein
LAKELDETPVTIEFENIRISSTSIFGSVYATLESGRTEHESFWVSIHRNETSIAFSSSDWDGMNNTGGSSDSSSSSEEVSFAKSRAKTAVLARLKAPSTAKFGTMSVSGSVKTGFTIT